MTDEKYESILNRLVLGDIAFACALIVMLLCLATILVLGFIGSHDQTIRHTTLIIFLIAGLTMVPRVMKAAGEAVEQV